MAPNPAPKSATKTQIPAAARVERSTAIPTACRAKIDAVTAPRGQRLPSGVKTRRPGSAISPTAPMAAPANAAPWPRSRRRGIRWTATPVVASAESPKAAESQRKERLRTASRAGMLRSGRSAAARAGAAPPSGSSPRSSGLRRSRRACGRMVSPPSTAASQSSALLQPCASTSQVASGTKTTLANPATKVSTVSARPRSRTNQLATTAKAGS